jgi:hypothetical protein
MLPWIVLKQASGKLICPLLARGNMYCSVYLRV